jgi:hypothetical protein
MALSADTRLGVYEILSMLGKGGMGEVYRARDTKLNRDVAIKVVPAPLVGDHERALRFEREAQTLAALNHPNVAQIYGTEGPAIVMEFVPGDDLAARLHRGAVPVDDAIAIARQIAQALEAAHALAIVHRDLKPANVKVSPDGIVKVLDFGLARMGSPDGAGATADGMNSPTITSPATALGVILGTAPYMSPEQARGRPVDKRADIWAFGCVLYEMLAGKAAFGGETITDVIASVVTKEPDWSALPRETPRHVRALLRRCLQKDPKQRWHDIADVRLELDAIEPDAGVAADAVPARARTQWVPLIVTAVIAAFAGAGAGVGWRASRETPPVEWAAQRLGGPAISMHPRVSPDGHLIAFQALVDGQSQIAVMKPGASSWTIVTSDRRRGSIQTASWAADGSSILYDRITDVPNGIYSVPALGGEERLVLENAGGPHPLSDGSLLFNRLNPNRAWQLHRFWPGTGKIEPLPVTSFDSWGIYPLAAPLLDGRVFVLGHPIDRTDGIDSLHVLDLNTGGLRPIAQDLREIIQVTADRATATALVVVSDGNVFRILRVSPHDSVPPQQVMTVLEFPGVDAGRNGELYASLHMRPTDVVIADLRGGATERLATSDAFLSGGAIALADGRVLIPTREGAGGALRGGGNMLVVQPGKEPSRFVQTDEETRFPMTRVDNGRVALVMGTASPREIAIVAADSGRILKRIKPPAEVTALGASSDGRTLFIGSGGTISALPIDGGPATPVCAGTSFAVDPRAGDLIVRLEDKERVRLMRCPAQGGPAVEVAVKGDVRLAATHLMPDAIRGGKLLVNVSAPDSWYWFAGSLDLATGRLEKAGFTYPTDFHFVTWTADGRVLASGMGVRSVLWKFMRK